MKLLILAYDFPPFISIGGLRPYSWYKYLPHFGVDVTVVTRNWGAEVSGEKNTVQNNAARVTEQTEHRKLINVPVYGGLKESISDKLTAGYLKRIRQAVTYAFGFLEYLNTAFDSKSALYFEADKLLQNEKFDFIMATGKPFILFRYAAMLSKKHNTPWIADYRDSWTMNHNQGQYSLALLESILNSFYKIIERKYVSTARIITTVAPTYIDVMPPFVNRNNIKIVYNGYDNEIETVVAGILPPKTKFVISYAGHIYRMQRLETFLEGVCIFLQESSVAKEEFEIHFWGLEADTSAIDRIMQYNSLLHPYVHFHNKTSYFEVMREISHSHVLLLLTSNSDSWLNAKVFDYLVLKRPVLMIGNETNIMSGILKETNGGVVTDNATATAAYIWAQFKVYKEANINNTVNYQQYSRKNQAEKLYLALKALT